MPDAPVIDKPRITIDVDRIHLFWTIGDDGGKPVTSVTIKYKNSSSENDWTKMKMSQSLLEYTVMHLEPGIFYDFKVLASNEIGDSEYSSVVTLATQDLGIFVLYNCIVLIIIDIIWCIHLLKYEI